MKKDQKIECDVHECEYCDCDIDCCSKDGIKVCNCNEDKNKESTMCDSFKCKEDK